MLAGEKTGVRVRRGRYRLIAVAAVLAAGFGLRLLGADNGVLDVKRKAAAQLVHDQRYAEAISLMLEVTAIDGRNFNDHLLLGKAYEKTGRGNEAIRQYRQTMELTAAGGSADERSGRAEADKRLKALDPAGAKIDATIEEFHRKLDGLERDAVATRSMTSIERIFRLRGTLWQVEGRKDRLGMEVSSRLAWQDTGFEVKQGVSYRVRAAGTWRTRSPDGKGHVETTANGLTNGPANNQGYRGQLVGRVGSTIILLGEDKVITAAATGRLLVLSNDEEAGQRKEDTGAIMMLIEPRG